jgi:hypothetical protein
MSCCEGVDVLEGLDVFQLWMRFYSTKDTISAVISVSPPPAEPLSGTSSLEPSLEPPL